MGIQDLPSEHVQGWRVVKDSSEHFEHTCEDALLFKVCPLAVRVAVGGRGAAAEAGVGLVAAAVD
jgi:hypothetical protein